MSIVWTDDKVALLKRLKIEKGLSASQICGYFPGSTRNGIIGKLNRLGIKAPTKSSIARNRKKEEARVASLKAEARDRIAKGGEKAGPGVDLMKLTEKHCRFPSWPHSGPTDGFIFCGKPRFKGSPYCAEHYLRTHDEGKANKAKQA